MKVKLLKKDIIEKISFLENIITEKSLNEILSHFLIIAENDEIKLKSTNLETAMICNVKGQILEPGNISILASKFAENIRNLPDESNITIETENNKIMIKSGNKKIKTQGYFKDDIPQIPKIKTEKNITLPQPLLKEILKKTMFATLKNTDGKQFLQGCFVNCENNQINVVGTDGFRLSEITRTIQFADENLNMIIPNKAVNELFKILGQTGEVNIKIGRKSAVFEIDDIKYFTRLIEEKFPNYKQLIPTESQTTVIIEKNKIVEALKWLKPYVDDNKKIIFEFKSNELQIKSESLYGNAKDKINIENDLNIQFPLNFDYINDFIKIVQGNNIFMYIINEKSQILFKDELDNDLIYISMPLRA